MTFIRILALSLVAMALTGCAKLENLQPANFSAYTVDASTLSNPAFIKGTYTEEKGGLLSGTLVRETFVLGLDGHTGFLAKHLNTSMPLSPGLHSLTIAYWIGEKRGSVPVRLDAKPGASYVIKEEDGEKTIKTVLSGFTPNYLYIADEKTGEIVTPKMADLLSAVPDRYQPPADAAVPIRGTAVRPDILDVDAVYVRAVDGRFVREQKSDALGGDDYYDYEAQVMLTPGLHALSIGLGAGPFPGLYPILFEAKPGAAYVVKFERGLKRNGTNKWFVYTVWIEDEKTGAVVMPKVDVQSERLRTL